MGEAKFPVLLENHWVEVNPRELSADAGCSGHPVLTKKNRLVATVWRAKPQVAPGLLLNKWCGSSFTLEVVKQGRVLQSLHERKKFTSSLAF